MKTLLILHHAKSSWKHPEIDDHKRPLDKPGKRDAPRMGKLLQDEDLPPNMIISSTAIRAKSIAAAYVTEACGYKGNVFLSQSLYEAESQSYLGVLHDVETLRVYW
jgi:phosphohistidine phosphatase